MSLETIVNVTISSQTRGVTRKGFGVALIAGYHTLYGARVREYSDLAGLTADGFTTFSPIYRAALALRSGTNKVPKFKVGRRALATSQVIWVTPTVTLVGEVLTIKVTFPDGTSTTLSRTNLVAETVATLSTAWAALLNALAASTATDDTTRVTFNSTTAGSLFYLEEVYGFDLYDKSADPGIATDLAAITAADGDWYGLLLDSNSEAEVNAASTVTEAQERLFGYATGDATARNGTAGGVMDDRFLAQVFRTFGIFSENTSGYAAARAMGECFPLDPGSETWKFKSLSGVTASILTASQESAIEGKNGNHYQIVAGLGILQQGVVHSGEFIDVVRGRDWLVARLRERVYGLLANARKVPFTDAGVDMVRNVVLAQLREGIGAGLLAASPEPVVTVPLVADVSTADKAARLLPDVEFSATLAGAIHAVEINGVISV